MRQNLNDLFLSVYLPTLILAFCNGLLLPILPVYAGTFTGAYSLIGLVLAAEALGTLLADIPAGSLLRRLDRKWVMVMGIGLVGLSVLALVWASSVWEVLAYRLIAGVGGALWNISRHAYLAESNQDVRSGAAPLRCFGGTNRLGTFAGPAVGGILAARFGYAVPFILFACSGSGWRCYCSRSYLSKRLSLLQQDKTQHSHHLWEILKTHHRVLLSAGTAQLLAQMVRSSRRVLIPLYGTDVLGLGLEAVGIILSASSFIDMVMFYPAGVIMDRFGRKFAIVPCFALQAIGVLLIPLTTGFALTDGGGLAHRVRQRPWFWHDDDARSRPCAQRRSG